MRMTFYTLSAALCLTCCFSCRHQKGVAYQLPDAMLPHVKKEYKVICDKGQALYTLNCASCHTTKVRRKEVIPDFSPEQLKGYALRISNLQHQSHMPDSLVTEEDLSYIMTFLAYKKKNR